MDILLARQPIFDAQDELAGYELLCRENARAEDANRILVDALLGVGLERVTDNAMAFLSVTREMLLGDSLDLLPPTTVVLQVPSAIDPDPELLAACERLRGAGYMIALDHFTYRPEIEPLLPLAHLVKLDVLQHAGPDLVQQVDQLRAYNVQLLAEKVENRGIHYVCLHLGFQFFQGYHFSRAETVTRRDLSVEHLRTFRLMKLIRDFKAKDGAIEEEFRTDVALSYKLLRIVNSASSGGQGIRSIGHAIRMLGREQLYRWLALLLIPPAAEGDVDAEKINATLMRARFCELLSDAGQRPLASGTLFMIGLLSGLDSYYGIPLSEVVEQLELAPEVRGALTSQGGPLGTALELAYAYEAGNWENVAEHCASLGIPEEALTNFYLDSMTWAHEKTSAVDDVAIAS